MQVIDRLNDADQSEARRLLMTCCASQKWIDVMLAHRPYADEESLRAATLIASEAMEKKDWLEAFSAHPRIGDVSSLRAKYADTKAWASAEQSGVASANEALIAQLAEYNQKYFERFGYIFIVCATGKTAAEMLSLLQTRLNNDENHEWMTAAREQQLITWIRLGKLAQ